MTPGLVEASQAVACRMGPSILSKSDYDITQYEGKDDFFSRVAISTISRTIKNKPFDQNGVMLSLNLSDRKAPVINGELLVKERADQLNLSQAKCAAVVEKNDGSVIDCEVINPTDKQHLYLNFYYKPKFKRGVFAMSSSKSDISILAKNTFNCM